MSLKQIAIKRITGQIETMTGLHIGSGSDKIEIGGMDNPIIRDPKTREPYIPGSSLKGKMRSLMEWSEGRLNQDGSVHKCPRGNESAECPICRVFGATDDNMGRGPTRLIVRDARLTKDSKEQFDQGEPIVEEKHENSINRITAVANPRPIERVVPGTTFDLDISYRILDMGDGGQTDEKMFGNVVLKALRLVELDFLGGGGSRGNGRVAFTNLKDENGADIALPESPK